MLWLQPSASDRDTLINIKTSKSGFEKSRSGFLWQLSVKCKNVWRELQHLSTIKNIFERRWLKEWHITINATILYYMQGSKEAAKGSYRGGLDLRAFPPQGILCNSNTQKITRSPDDTNILKTLAFLCKRYHIRLFRVVCYLVQKASLQVSQSPHTHALPVCGERAAHTGSCSSSTKKTELPGGATCKTVSPVRFCMGKEANVTSRMHPLQASQPRRRAKDTASWCALVPAGKVINTAFVANKRQNTPHLSAFSQLSGGELHINSCRNQPKQGNLRRASEKGAAAWVKCHRLTLVWSGRCLSSAEDAPDLRYRKMKRHCHSIQGSHWLFPPCVSAPLDNVRGTGCLHQKSVAIGWAEVKERRGWWTDLPSFQK